jgi:hypothetical protein
MSKFLFRVWGLYSGTLFRLGMWLVRCSSYRLCLSSNNGWSIEHWTSDDCKLDADSRARYAADLKVMLWAIAEPGWDTAGQIPLAQYMLLKEMVASIWTGGRTVAVVALIDEVMAEEDLIVC